MPKGKGRQQRMNIGNIDGAILRNQLINHLNGNNIPLKDAAAQCGCSIATLSRFVSGKGFPNRRTAHRIKTMIGVSNGR